MPLFFMLVYERHRHSPLTIEAEPVNTTPAHQAGAARVGDFYRVIKTIKGKPYLYKQRTFRVRGKVRTESPYIGPASAADVASVRAESQARKAGPSHAKVRAIFKRLGASVQGSWVQPWSDTGPVNTTFERWSAFDRATEALGAKLIHDPVRNVAAFNPYLDHVTMPPGEHFIEREGYSATQAYYYALSHELTHWSGHSSRLARKLVTNPQNRKQLDEYAREEMVAEASAMLILAETGRLPADISNHAKYFQKWHSATLNKQDAMDYAMDEAQRAASFILAAVNTTLA